MGYFKVLAHKPDASESVLETCMIEVAPKGHLISELVNLRSLRPFPGQSWLLRSSFQNSAEPNHPTLTQVVRYVWHTSEGQGNKTNRKLGSVVFLMLFYLYLSGFFFPKREFDCAVLTGLKLTEISVPLPLKL